MRVRFTPTGRAQFLAAVAYIFGGRIPPQRRVSGSGQRRPCDGSSNFRSRAELCQSSLTYPIEKLSWRRIVSSTALRRPPCGWWPSGMGHNRRQSRISDGVLQAWVGALRLQSIPTERRVFLKTLAEQPPVADAQQPSLLRRFGSWARLTRLTRGVRCSRSRRSDATI